MDKGSHENREKDLPAEKSRRQEAKPGDLDERTARFAEAIIAFARKIPVTPVTRDLITQLVDAGTSVAANYCEADDAISRKEFRKNISTCRKEARETKFWLRATAAAVPDLRDEARPLWQEAKELHLIFSKIFRKVSGA